MIRQPFCKRPRWPLGCSESVVLANGFWLHGPGLKSALAAARTPVPLATINSMVWLLASSLSWWPLTVATVISLGLAVAWLVIDGEPWDRPADSSTRARKRSRVYKHVDAAGTGHRGADLFSPSSW